MYHRSECFLYIGNTHVYHKYLAGAEVWVASCDVELPRGQSVIMKWGFQHSKPVLMLTLWHAGLIMPFFKKKKKGKGSSLLPKVPFFVCSQIQVDISVKSGKGAFFFSFLKNLGRVVSLEKIKNQFWTTMRKAALVHTGTKVAGKWGCSSCWPKSAQGGDREPPSAWEWLSSWDLCFPS